MKPIRILLADDQPVQRAGLRALLAAERDLEVAGEAADGREAVERAEQLKPDVVLMDLSMPGLDGLEAIRRVAALGQGTRVLALTAHAEEAYLLPVLEAGGSGYVRKSSADEDLATAIRAVVRDEVFLYPNAAALLLQGFRPTSGPGREDPPARLTEREREVLRLTAEGLAAADIGERLHVPPETVDACRTTIVEKLGLTRRGELVRFASRAGLLKPE